MTSAELRQKYLDFFRSKGHAVIPSASLIPENDPSVLFTTAGMHPLVPYLLGEPHPSGRRLVSVQKCIRTGDIDDVGDAQHLTFFEMLGNWSLGDYFKREAITWSYEFLTDQRWLGLDPTRLAVSVFSGDADAPRDEESVAVWQSLGVPDARIAYLGKEDNWWPAGGKNPGPQGPDTEMFYWTGKGAAPAVFDPKNDQWVEIWNDVFMQFNRTAAGQYEPLVQQNVDTGMGLERTLVALNGFSTIYETDLFLPLLKYLQNCTGIVDKHELQKLRIIADHLRAACFMAADGIQPSNKDRGYVMRRLIRRSLVYARQLEFKLAWLPGLVTSVCKTFDGFYSQLDDGVQAIIKVLEEEAEKFGKALERGLHEFDKRYPPMPQLRDYTPGVPMEMDVIGKPVGVEAFDFHQTYGFPKEVIRELLQERLYKFNEEEFDAKFNEKFKKHQELSRTASTGQFKGGLTDHSGLVVRLHTATHLLNAALRKVLGDQVWQRGSNITAERTRFDFSHEKKLTDEEKQKVEALVNGWIARDLTVEKKILPLEEARKLGSIGVFGEKYPDTVSIYTMIDAATGEVVSREFCGGPHVSHTSEIGTFKILKEEASSAGVRRIKASVL